MKECEKLYSSELSILFSDVDSVNDQLTEIVFRLKKVFYNVIVHYDLSDEVDQNGMPCFGIRIELFKYDISKQSARTSMCYDIGQVIKDYVVCEHSVRFLGGVTWL